MLSRLLQATANIDCFGDADYDKPPCPSPIPSLVALFLTTEISKCSVVM